MNGSPVARLLTNSVPAAAVAAAAYTGWVWIQTSPMYRAGFKVPDLFRPYLDLSFPAEGIWRHFFAAAVTASSISYIQVALSLLLAFAALRMLLRKVGDWGARRGAGDYSGTETLALACTNLLPLLGMFSTVVGVVMAESLPSRELRLLIFGPTGLGILGVMLGKVVYLTARKRET